MTIGNHALLPRRQAQPLGAGPRETWISTCRIHSDRRRSQAQRHLSRTLVEGSDENETVRFGRSRLPERLLHC